MFNIEITHLLYTSLKPFPYHIQDNILNYDFAIKCQNEILLLDDKLWDRYNNPFEQKYTLRNKNELPNNVNKLFEFLSSQSFIDELSSITGTSLFLDPNKNWYGIHKFKHGDYLDIHCDAGLHPINGLKKHITLGIYLSKNWKDENNGHLELWKGDNINKENCKIFNCFKKISPTFNKLVIFNNTTNAWHGSPEPVIINHEESRIFLTVSYLSKDLSNDSNKYKKAYFINKPNDPYNEEKEKLRELRCSLNTCKHVYNIT
jgi:Rps23 Pro-64 3,4-dihydroxylase Tpa1-like proline 4-hydroxylase